MSELTERFLQLFTDAERLVAAAAQRPDSASQRESFMSNLRDAEKRDSRFKADTGTTLRACASLRNVLVHERYKARYLAEPRQELVDELQRLIDRLHNPPRVIQHFKCSIREFSEADAIGAVLRYTAEHDFSQVAVRRAGRLELLSANTLQRWLAHHAAAAIIELDVTVADVLQYREPGATEIRFAPRECTLTDAQAAFAGGQSENLLSLVITERGRAEEKPLALVTPWDLGALAGLLA